jgi:2-iminobutanoate/2-iminopropanoate deaminase
VQTVTTRKAPRAIGPYAQAVIHGNMVFTSGQLPLDPETGETVSGGIEEQTRRVLENLREVLAEAGSSPGRVMKTTVFLKDLSDFERVNEIYAEYLGATAPARSCVEVSRLPKEALIEVEAVGWCG